jgi:hypothetical protein
MADVEKAKDLWRQVVFHMKAYVHECRPTLHSFVESIDKDMQAALNMPATETVKESIARVLDAQEKTDKFNDLWWLMGDLNIIIQAAQKQQPEEITEKELFKILMDAHPNYFGEFMSNKVRSSLTEAGYKIVKKD